MHVNGVNITNMGIFFGDVIYGLRYLDLSGDDYVTVYERAPDVGFPLDKPTIRKILMDEQLRGGSDDRIYQIYTYYITTHTNDSITKKDYMWRTIDRSFLQAQR